MRTGPLARKESPQGSAPASRVAWLVLVAAALVVHLPALPGNFFWDDYDWIVNNPKVRGSDGLYRLWFTFNDYDYWPMHYSTHWFEWRAWGAWATPYRILNQLFHALCAVLLWRVLLLLRVPGAWLVALIFAVHPLSVESVVWISQRKTVQSTAGAFAALWFYLRFLETGRRRMYGWALVCFAAGLLTKPSVVMWPLVLLIATWWVRRRIARRDLLATIPFFAFSLLLGLIGMGAKRTQIGIEFAREDSLFSRLAIAGRAVWFYAEKAVLPVNLSVVYPRWQLGRQDAAAFLPLAALVAVFALAFVYRKGRGAPVLAGFGYYVVNLVPVLGFTAIMFMRYSLVADHYQYLSLPGLLALIIGSATHWVRSQPRLLPVARAVAAALVVLLAFGSWQDSRIWRGADAELIWRDVLEHNPHSELAHLQLGYVLARQGRFVEGARHVAEAAKYSVPPVSWNPAVDPTLWHEIAEHPLANSTVGAEPPSLRVHFVMGSALYAMGQIAQAAEHFTGCIQRGPKFAAAHYDLALCLQRFGHSQEADSHRMIALELAGTAPPPR